MHSFAATGRGGSTQANSTRTSREEQPRVPDEYLVTLAPDVDKGIIFEYYGSFGIKDVFALGGETFLLVLVNDPGPKKMESVINEENRIVVVQPNLIYWDNRSGRITK